MANTAPGVSINVNASSATAQPLVSSTGSWFVIGNASGIANVPVPVSSIGDFTKYFGRSVNGSITGRYTFTSGSVTLDSTTIYDALDVFFREGGTNAYVVAMAPASGGTTATTTVGTNVYTANSIGTWANAASGSTNGLIITIANVTVNSYTTYNVTITYNGTTLATSPGLFTEIDIKNWVNSLPSLSSLCTVTTTTGSSALPSANTSVSVYLGSGTTSTAGSEGSTLPTFPTNGSTALATLSTLYGPGQVSAPGVTDNPSYALIANHAQAYNRVALLDGVSGATASTLVSAVQTLQGAATDASYASIFAPWVIAPGIINTNPSGSTATTFSRTVAPSAFAAAKMSMVDINNDCNVPAAGVINGDATYITGIQTVYSATDRATLNSNGVNVIRLIENTGQIALYGFRSCSFDPNWVFLNNVRFRMQVVRDFDNIAENFVFQEIDGRGQLFAKLASALSGQCQAYWVRNSIYGQSPASAFSVNTGTALNTPATIGAGQINAQVNLRMSPFGELVSVNVTKYAINANIPA
jgi:hypothetical protein